MGIMKKKEAVGNENQENDHLSGVLHKMCSEKEVKKKSKIKQIIPLSKNLRIIAGLASKEEASQNPEKFTVKGGSVKWGLFAEESKPLRDTRPEQMCLVVCCRVNATKTIA